MNNDNLTTVNSITANTSSRLSRGLKFSSEIEYQKQNISDRAIAYCHESLDRSRFFRSLKDGKIPMSLMQYVFLQFYFWRDRLHQWFGLCIVKAGSCSDSHQKLAILSLADHTFTELQDDHSQMYLEFLYSLGIDYEAIDSSRCHPATEAYIRSFFDDFGYETNNFYAALVALSGRELCASLRNQIIMQYYFDANSLDRPIWLSLHAGLEIEHFHDHLCGALTSYAENSFPHRGSFANEIDDLMKAVEWGVDRHIQYFEDLFQEYESRS